MCVVLVGGGAVGGTNPGSVRGMGGSPARGCDAIRGGSVCNGRVILVSGSSESGMVDCEGALGSIKKGDM